MPGSSRRGGEQQMSVEVYCTGLDVENDTKLQVFQEQLKSLLQQEVVHKLTLEGASGPSQLAEARLQSTSTKLLVMRRNNISGLGEATLDMPSLSFVDFSHNVITLVGQIMWNHFFGNLMGETLVVRICPNMLLLQASGVPLAESCIKCHRLSIQLLTVL